MLPPIPWTDLERHPLSAEYANIEGADFDRYVENLDKNKILNNRKITLYEGKILDGWQLFRACSILELEPEFQNLPPGIDPDVFVQTMNDCRRHETPETAARRINARRERIAAARQSGQSTRQIADAEGISQTTVRRDLDTSGEPPGSPDISSITPSYEYIAPMIQGVYTIPGEPPGSPEYQNSVDTINPGEPPGSPAASLPPTPPSQETVTGKDGKAYPAKRTRKTATTTNGRETFDDSQIEGMIGKLVRVFDARQNAFGKSPRHAVIEELLQQVFDTYTQWREETT